MSDQHDETTTNMSVRVITLSVITILALNTKKIMLEKPKILFTLSMLRHIVAKLSNFSPFMNILTKFARQSSSSI